MTSSPKKCIVFDLDDTLFKEIEYLKSAYYFIAELLEDDIKVNIFTEMIDLYQSGNIVLDVIFKKYPIRKFNVKDLVYIYRYHTPNLSLKKENLELLKKLKKENFTIGLITDGRSKTQRSKLKALGIIDFFDEILISEEFGSEKPKSSNFLNYMVKFPNQQYFYIGDNTKKDFITPNRLGWTTIGLSDNGKNIHKQNLSLSQDYLPQHWVNDLNQIITFL